MFYKNLHTIVQKGINIYGLLSSDILNYEFDFDEWPTQHTDDNKYLRPYNGSIFDIQYAYGDIFYEPELQDIIGNIEGDVDLSKGIDSSKVYKI